MRALVIGAAGFVGKYLSEYLLTLGYDVYATKLENETLDIPAHDLDILDTDAIQSLLKKLRPNRIFHLAAQSSVALSWQNPALTMNVNILGTLNLLESLRRTDNPPRTLLIGSGEEYGAIRPEELPVTEDALPRPGNPYAISKLTQGLLGTLYAKAHRLPVIVTRSFNHTGPGQPNHFVVSSFAKQIAAIEKGLQPPVIAVGNLSAKRDFTDVRDVIKAYSMLAENGTPGETYNVGSGKPISIQEILDTLLTLTDRHITIEVDPERLRPSDTPVITANVTKLREATRWAPVITLEKTLEDMLAWWRSAVS